MALVDLAILSVIIISTLISLLRGFAREALSLVSWVVSFWGASRFASELAMQLPESISSPGIRFGLAFVAIFIVLLIVFYLFGLLVMQLIKATALGMPNRLLGLVFGAARGIVVVLLLVVIGGMTPLTERHWWGDSLLLGYCQQAIDWMNINVSWQEISEYVVKVVE